MRLTDAECAVLAQLLERVEVPADASYIELPNTSENWDVVRMVEDQLEVEARHRRECPPEDTPIELSVATLVRAFALRFGANR